MSASAVVETVQATPEVWSRLELSAEWAALTPSQKIWVTSFLATGNALAATKSGYHPKNDTQARVMSYEHAQNPSIVAALDIAAGKVKTEWDDLIDSVRAHLKAAPKGSEAAAKFAEQLERLLALRSRISAAGD